MIILKFSEQFTGWDIYEINIDWSDREHVCFYSLLRVVCTSYQTAKEKKLAYGRTK